MKLFLLKALATWLADNNKDIIRMVIDAINRADAWTGDGSEKLKYVRSIAVPILTGKAGWLVDAIIHMLLAYIRKGAK